MQKNEETVSTDIDTKKSKKEDVENETLDENTSIGLRNIMIWIITIVVTLASGFIFDLDKGFGKIILIAIAYAIWNILHRIFNKK